MEDLIRAKIRHLLEQHRVMTLATLRPDGWPQATTVTFASEDLILYFICDPASQKAANLARDERVSLTVDHDPSDVTAIEGLSMAARAEPVMLLGEVMRIMDLIAGRYPDQPLLAGLMPRPETVRAFRVVPKVISLLDYSKGFGHAELVIC